MVALSVSWAARPTPIPPLVVVGYGDAARALCARLLLRDDATLSRLSGARSAGLIVVRSDDPAQLPWADGAVYLGRDPAAPTLYVPTTQLPTVPLALLERALRLRFPNLAPPLAVLPTRDGVLSLVECRQPILRASLLAWQGENQ